ncbi:MAG: heme exporter protein CcmB [Bacteroidia bacterium]
MKFFLAEEWKGKHAIIGAFLYIFTAVLITFLTLPGMDKPHFSAIFWIVVIFTTLQGVSRSFIQMRKQDFAFWQQITSPQIFLASKLISSFLLMLVFTLFAYLVFIIMHGSVSAGGNLFLLVTLVCGIGISSIFTISSSIASKTDNPGVLLPVLTFPIILPQVLVGVKAGKKAIDELGFETVLPDLLVLMAFNVLIVSLGLILIKFIWKD